jgi:ABC-type Na+ efflux pump permease subunit
MTMFRSALFLARKDVQYMLRHWETIFWTFLMPVVFFYFIGTITGGFGDDGPAKDPLVVETDPGAGFLGAYMKTRLRTVGYDVLTPEEARPDSKAARLRIPAAFTDSVLAGHTTPVSFTPSRDGLSGQYDTFRIRRAVYTLLGDLVSASAGGNPPTSETLDLLAQAPRTLSLEVTKAGRRRDIPNGFEQAIPGTMVMFTLLVLLTSGSILLVIERKERLLQRLASTPLSRRTIILGKWGGRWFLGMVQIAFAMIVGTLLFRMHWGPNLPALFVVLAVYAGLVAFLGILLGSLARTEGQAVGIGVLASNVLAALGGCWWPIEVTPDWMQRLALFLPTGWAMDALHKLVNFGAPPTAVLPHLAVMIAASVVAAGLSARVFRFQ